ncbi:unnamed protein product [Ectocarpus sp. CCAP 1310/34]|nr:unnamed protein product [Ectocarpus sp. CCAP 1310/34]
MLEYDNSAFYYFTLSLISIYLVPVTLVSLKQILRAIIPARGAVEARTSAEKTKCTRMKKDKAGLSVLWRWSFVTKVLTLIPGWACFFYLLNSMTDDAEIKGFDPFAILGVTPSTEAREIKKQYRALSLIYHPDKNPDNKVAEDMFMKIAKAYEALTDQTAMDNWRKFGNPDGKQPMEVSIALPTFLLEKEHHNTILIIYLIAMVVIIPSIVAMWYARSKKYGEKNVMYDSYAWYNHMLSDSSEMKNMPEVLAGSAEFRALNTPDKDRPMETKEVAKLYRQLYRESTLMPKPKYDHPVIKKGAVQVFAHLAQKPMSPELKKNLDTMLIKTPDLIEAMIELACSRRWLNTTIYVINFSQYIHQGLWLSDNTLLQLPHIGEAEARTICTTSVPGKPAVKGIAQYIKLPREERKGLDQLTPEQQEEVHRVCSIIPDVTVKVDIFVEDESEIAENDLVTIKVTLTRNNVEDGSKVQPVYAPKYPVFADEGWWVLVGDINRKTIFSFERITDNGRVVSKEVKMMAPNKPGTVKLDVFVKSDSYVGLDQKQAVQFEVVSAANLPQYEPHPDDLELDNEPTLFEQVMQAYDDETDSEDEDGGAQKTIGDGEEGDSSGSGSDSEDESDEEDD